MVGPGLLAGTGGGSCAIPLLLFVALALRFGDRDLVWLWVLLAIVAFASGILTSRLAELDSRWQTAVSGAVAGATGAAIFIAAALVLVRDEGGVNYTTGWLPLVVMIPAAAVGAVVHAQSVYQPRIPYVAPPGDSPSYIRIVDVPPPVEQSKVQTWSATESEMVEVGQQAVIAISTTLDPDEDNLIAEPVDEYRETELDQQGVVIVPGTFALVGWSLVSLLLPAAFAPVTLLLVAAVAGLWTTHLRQRNLRLANLGGGPSGLFVGLVGLAILIFVGLSGIGPFLGVRDGNFLNNLPLAAFCIGGGMLAGWLAGLAYRRLRG